MSMLTLVVISCLLGYSSSIEFYVIPPAPPYYEGCPVNEVCYTLDAIIATSSLYAGYSDVLLYLLDGNHDLTVEDFLRIEHLEIIAARNLSPYPVSIRHNNSGFFIVAEYVRFENIEFNSCLVRVNAPSERSLWLTLRNTTFRDGGMFLYSADVNGVVIDRSNFINAELFLNMVYKSGIVRDLLIDIEPYTTVISRSNFTGEKSVRFQSFIRILNTSVFLNLTGNHFNNERLSVLFLTNSNRSTVDKLFETTITNCSIDRLRAFQFSATHAYLGIYNSSIAHCREFLVAPKPLRTGKFFVRIESVLFYNNTFPAIISGREISHCLTLKNVNFTEQNARGNSFEPALRVYGPLNVTVEDCVFDKCFGRSALGFISVEAHFLGTTVFSNNKLNLGGSLGMVAGSVLYLHNGTTIHFVNNTASDRGGAMVIEENIIALNSYGFSGSYPACVYQLAFDLEGPQVEDIPVALIFENNTALFGGDDIFGVALFSDCPLTPNQDIVSYQIQDRIFKIKNRTDSSVTGISRRVCFCENDTPNCATRDYIYHVSVTPGEEFYLNVALVGNDFGVTTGSVYAMDRSGFTDTFFGRQLQQITKRGCGQLSYSVHPQYANITEISFILSRSDDLASSQVVYFTDEGSYSTLDNAIELYETFGNIRSELLLAPAFIEVSLLPCPKGLRLDNNTVCNCLPELEVFVTSCTVQNSTTYYTIEGTNWIGSIENNGSVAIVAYNYCPFMYCLTSDREPVTLSNSDTQCRSNHAGILCGQCREGFSLAIGSSNCLSCENNYGLSLLVFFAVAGWALFLFIKFLDFTVTQGYINGLIFYANIIWIYQEVFFVGAVPDYSNGLRQYYNVLRVFIAWLNLDFGIEICFAQNLDAYIKTWLQFLFPFYILTISAGMILLCNVSTRATKWFGSNALSVLVTLFQLSATKLLRTTVIALSPAKLSQFEPSGIRSVWSLDGNVDYFGVEHSFLAFASIAVLFVWLFISTVLLFPTYFQKLCRYRSPALAIRVKTVLDAFNGPLKAKHQYWVGLTLFVRLVLSLVTTFSARNENFKQFDVSFAILLPAILATISNRVYKKKFVFILEYISLLNLVILGIAFIRESAHLVRFICICISVSICLVLFFVIILIHFWLLIKRKCNVKKFMDNCKERFKRANKSIIKSGVLLSRGPVEMESFVTRADYNYREELL